MKLAKIREAEPRWFCYKERKRETKQNILSVPQMEREDLEGYEPHRWKYQTSIWRGLYNNQSPSIRATEFRSGPTITRRKVGNPTSS